MEKIGPADIIEHAERVDLLAGDSARARARDRGARGAKLDAAEQRAVAKAQRENPVVTAEAFADGAGAVARFWARLYLAGNLWHVSGTLARSPYGRIMVREIALKPWRGHDAEPSANVLRALSVSLVKERALEALRATNQTVQMLRELERAANGKVKLDVTAAEEAVIAAGAEVAGPRRPALGRRGGGPDFYRGVARDAVRIASMNLPIYRTLADERGVEPETARKWISKAREMGFLVKSPNVWDFGPHYGKEEGSDVPHEPARRPGRSRR